MMTYQLHFLRPDWLLAIIPLAALGVLMLRQKSAGRAWQTACDAHLLPHLLDTQSQNPRQRAVLYLLGAALCMILALAGPSGTKLPVPIYEYLHPRVLLLDVSHESLTRDLKPDRLTRAKFKLHDLFQHQDKGQFGLIAYTEEPFVVSPITHDAQTIDALIDPITPDIMPIDGLNLERALQDAAHLIQQTGAGPGDILVLTGTAPSQAAIKTAKKLAAQHIYTSILPLTTTTNQSARFNQFAQAGHGLSIPFKNTTQDLDTWLNYHAFERSLKAKDHESMPMWRDDGRWLMIPALLLLLIAFRRDWTLRLRP
ncbi:MAG: VWA domain-containing protein [Legionella sp.]|jgi:Ca-activated chloride channel family protein|nr:VWA domain-containing protein [Legionella sp.]